MRVQDFERGGGENAVAEGAQTDYRDPRSGRQPVQYWGRDCGHALFFDSRFVDQHYRDVIANRINAAALSALQSLAAFSEVERGFAEWANENL